MHSVHIMLTTHSVHTEKCLGFTPVCSVWIVHGVPLSILVNSLWNLFTTLPSLRTVTFLYNINLTFSIKFMVRVNPSMYVLWLFKFFPFLWSQYLAFACNLCSYLPLQKVLINWRALITSILSHLCPPRCIPFSNQHFVFFLKTKRTPDSCFGNGLRIPVKISFEQQPVLTFSKQLDSIWSGPQCNSATQDILVK